MELLHNFCCICLEEKPDFQRVTECDSNGVQYSQKLSVCDPQQEWNDQSLAICKDCSGQVDIAYNFINLCKKSYELRKERLQQFESEKKQFDTETFTCYNCQKTFKQKRFLKSHITRMHLSSNEKSIHGGGDCKIENPEIDNNIEIQTVKSEEKGELFGQDETDQDYFSHNDAAYESSEEDEKPKNQQKVKSIKKPESLTCEYCGKQFNRHQHWSAHIRSKHTFEKPYKCQLCEASFATSHSLLVHKRNHNNEKPYICSTCGKRFVCSGDLFHHNKIHLNKKEYECGMCQKRFNTTSILRTHKIVKHTQPEDWKYVCTLCERRFPINSSLTLHMKRHTGVKDHSCHICGKKFFNKSEVSKHIMSHSNQKNFKCNLCEDKEYKNKEGLNKHLKIVHDLGTWKAPKLEKKFLCMLCPRRFTFNNKLQRHLLSHTGEKPYKCDYCDKKFADVYYRKSHMKKEHADRLDGDESDDKFALIPAGNIV